MSVGPTLGACASPTRFLRRQERRRNLFGFVLYLPPCDASQQLNVMRLNYHEM